MSKKTGGYVRMPEIPTEVERRLRIIQQVSAGLKPVSQAAAEMGLSRVQTQSLLHRSEAGAAAALVAKPPGRPRRSTEDKARDQKLARLRRDNQKLQSKLSKMENALLTAAEVISGRVLASRQVWARERKPAAQESPRSEPEKPGGPAELLAAANEMKQQGLDSSLVASVIGCSPSTLGRWSRRQQRGQPLRSRRGPGRVPVCSHDHAGQVVKDLAGMIGAAALAKRTGLSRRQAAGVKTLMLREMERARKQTSQRVVVSEPGIVRGFDQMYVWTNEGWRYPLIAADGSVPFRTSVVVSQAYNEDSVLAALRADIEAWGPPLVYRMDRYSAHQTPKVHALLKQHGVLVLHGPPHHPRYYGQLERQNREHRQYLSLEALPSAALLPRVCLEMIQALNTTWPRRALRWKTPAQIWGQRRSIGSEERSAFCAEVYDRHARLKLK